MKSSKLERYFHGDWSWLASPKEPDYEITGKYLFFDPDKENLIGVAEKEIGEHGFHKVKVTGGILPKLGRHPLRQ